MGKAFAEQINIAGSDLYTDSWAGDGPVGQQFVSHETVNHRAGEYVRGSVSTNKAENFFSQLKRSIDGTHHNFSAEHFPRYLAEFDFRYSNRTISDTERMERLVSQTAGRCLTYMPLKSS